MTATHITNEDIVPTMDQSICQYIASRDILLAFQKVCSSPKFLVKHSHREYGFEPVGFVAHELDEDSDRFQQFVKIIHDGGVRLAIAFHGTDPRNLPSILATGLDASKRCGQSLGPGEYFATKASVSASYCRRGNVMVVCVIVFPEQLKSRRDNEVVVENNQHHIPIGVLLFDRPFKFVSPVQPPLDPQGATLEQQRKELISKRVQNFAKRYLNDDMDQDRQHQCIADQIVRDLKGNRAEMASALYIKYEAECNLSSNPLIVQAVLQATCKRDTTPLTELSIPNFFPGLDLSAEQLKYHKNCGAISAMKKWMTSLKNRPCSLE